MVENKVTPGFDAKREPDDYMQEKLVKYNLPPDASLAEVEPLATELLGSAATLMRGMELVFNRRISSDTDKPLIQEVFVLGNTGKARFGIALLGFVAEQMAKAADSQEKKKQ